MKHVWRIAGWPFFFEIIDLWKGRVLQSLVWGYWVVATRTSGLKGKLGCNIWEKRAKVTAFARLVVSSSDWALQSTHTPLFEGTRRVLVELFATTEVHRLPEEKALHLEAGLTFPKPKASLTV